MNSVTQLLNIIDELQANGVTPKVTKLKPSKKKQKTWMKGNGPTPNVGLHDVNTKAGYNPHGNNSSKLA